MFHITFSVKFEWVRACCYQLDIKVNVYHDIWIYDFITIRFHWKTINDNIELSPSSDSICYTVVCTQVHTVCVKSDTDVDTFQHTGGKILDPRKKRLIEALIWMNGLQLTHQWTQTHHLIPGAPFALMWLLLCFNVSCLDVTCALMLPFLAVMQKVDKVFSFCFVLLAKLLPQSWRTH